MKIVGEKPKKCPYYNKGYCKYTRKEGGCQNVHLKSICKKLNCKHKSCELKTENNAKINNLVSVQLQEIEELRSENNVLKLSLQTSREYINVTLVSKDAEIEGCKEDNEGLRVQLFHSNNLTIQNRD